MKPLELCKLRLSSVLDGTQRSNLVLWMLQRTADALISAMDPSSVCILGGDDRVRMLAEARGLCWLSDNAGDLNKALDSFTSLSRNEGWNAALFVAGDLPRLEANDVRALIEACSDADAVIASGARGGTNAVLIPTWSDFRFQLGGRSYERHLAQFAHLGLRWRDRTTPALHQDVDMPSDLAQLLRVEPRLWDLLNAEDTTAKREAGT
jgi:2-phospho-L-lactate guanylyltransferase